jgi:hypothetical protein
VKVESPVRIWSTARNLPVPLLRKKITHMQNYMHVQQKLYIFRFSNVQYSWFWNKTIILPCQKCRLKVQEERLIISQPH